MISVGIGLTSRKAQHIVEDSDLISNAFERSDTVIPPQWLPLSETDQEVSGVLEDSEQLQRLVEIEPQARWRLVFGLHRLSLTRG